jgi:hypothetical protein
MQSTYLKNADANWVKGTTYPAAPSTVYITLHSADPSLTGANEIAFDARISVTTFSTVSTVGLSRQCSVNEAITFVDAPSTSSATHWGAWDSLTGGNFLRGGEFLDEDGNPSPIAFTIANDATIASGTIFFAIQRGVFSDYFIDAKLNWMRGVTFPAAPTNIYASLGTNLQSDGTGTDSGIAREIVSFGANTTIPNYIRITNDAQVEFTQTSVTVNSAGFHDAATLGNLLWVGSYSERTFALSDSIIWETGRINVDF